MAWSFIYGTTGYTTGSVTSYDLPLAATVQVGDLLTLAISGGAWVPATVAITDPLGNAWTLDGAGTSTGVEQVIVYHSRVTVAGTYSKLTIAPPSSQQFTAEFLQARAAGGTLTATHSGGAGGTAASATSGTVTWSGDALVVGCWSAENAGTLSAGTGYTLGPAQTYVAGTAFGAAIEYRLDDASGSASPGLTYSTTGNWAGLAVAYALTASTATLTPPSPASGGLGQQSAAWSIDLDYPAPAGGLAIPLATDVSGNTFQLTQGGNTNVTSVTIPAGSTSGTFYYTGNTAGTSHVTLGPTTGITFVGNGAAYTTTAVAATGYTFSGPSGGIVGQASTNFTVTLNGTPTGTIIVTITPSGGGLSTPITLSFSGSTTTLTTTITPTALGTVTLTPSNNGGLTNPSVLHYTVTTAPSLWTYRSCVGPFTSGLATVGYRVIAHDLSVYKARTTTGVSEIASGCGFYAADISLPFSGNYHVLWDDGQGAPTYGCDTVCPLIVETTGLNQAQATSLLLAANTGKSSGFSATGASAGAFLGADGITGRISGATDQWGNRSSSTLTPPT